MRNNFYLGDNFESIVSEIIIISIEKWASNSSKRRVSIDHTLIKKIILNPQFTMIGQNTLSP